VQQKIRKFPTLGKRNCTANFTYTVYTVYKNLCTNGDTWKDKSQPQKQEEYKRQITSLPYLTCP
jgi:hypothetical protein